MVELKQNKKEENIHEYTDETWSLFLYSMKSSITRQKYVGRLDKFFDFLQLEGENVERKSLVFLESQQVNGDKWVFDSIFRFMKYQLERVNNKEITGSTVRNYLKSIKLFCEITDISINWKKITRGLPKGKNYADDRIPTNIEIQKILEYPDRRIKALICTMISSGIRLGAWDYLRWGNIRPIQNDGKTVAAKIIVYAGEEDEYFSFISEEAYGYLKDWINYREKSGEIIDPNSWLMRDLWDTGAVQGGRGLISKPNKLASSGIKRLIERALWAQGLRVKLEDGRKRHEFQAVHSFRKLFKTRCELGGMKPINIEILLSHTVGISSSYYRPTETDLLEDYLKVSDLLSIDASLRSQKELQRNEQQERELQFLKEQESINKDAISNLSDQVNLLLKEVDNMKKTHLTS